MSSPCGRFGDLWSSNAMGENSTSAGADLPLYFCRQRVLDEVLEVVLELRSPASPANDSL